MAQGDFLRPKEALIERFSLEYFGIRQSVGGSPQLRRGWRHVILGDGGKGRVLSAGG